MRDSVVVGIRGNVYNWLSYGLCFLVRNSVVLAVYLLFLVSASLPYMSICAGVVIAVPFQQIDDAPHGKTAADGDHKHL